LSGPVLKDEIDHLIYAFFQQVTEDAATPFKKAFTLHTTQPDFSVSAGYFQTIWERFATASQSTKICDAIAESLKFTVEPGGMLMYEVVLVGRGAPVTTANPSGAWSLADHDESTDFYYCEDLADISFTKDSPVSLTLTGPMEIGFSRELHLIGHDGSGNFETFGLGPPTLDFSFTVLDDSTFRIGKLQTAHQEATQCHIITYWGASDGSADGDLVFNFYGKLNSVEPVNDDIQGVKVTGKMLGADASTAPITLTMSNTKDRTW